MALEFADTLATARANQITAARDNAATAGEIRLYTAPRPAKGGAATLLLGELTFADPSSPTAVAGALTANAITGDPSANATGSLAWFREVDGDGVFVMDGDVGVAGSGADLIVNTASVVAGLPINITSYVNTEGNL